jgi:signal transduction histidine kinase
LENSPTPSTGARAAASQQIGLASWLGGGSVFIVLIAVAAMAVACTVLLNRMVQQQALVRAQLAVTSARELLRRTAEDALSDARVLAERPTLQRLVNDHSDAALEPFLRRFCENSATDVCALTHDWTLLAKAGPEIDWNEVVTASKEQGERFGFAPKSGGSPVWGAVASVPGTDDVRAVVLKVATPALLAGLGTQVGGQLTLVNFARYTAPPDDPLTPVHSQALTTGGTAALRLASQDGYAASVVLSASTGEVIGLLDARVSAAEFASSVRNFNRVLTSAAAIVAAFAGLLGVYYGRWLARPVVALRDAALRIGRGDFTAAIPAFAPMEVGALARSMDEMRRNLVDLTDTLRRREAEAQAVLGGVVEGVYAVDGDRRIRYANAQVASLLGRSERDIIGQFCGDVLQPALVNGERPCERYCPILLARAGTKATAREALCLRDGSTRSTIIVSSPAIRGFQVQILRDETDLEAARRARDSVLGNISHEFRTPLAAQLAAIELLRDGAGDMPPEAQRELLANLERGVLRLMQLIDNLLESVRIESGQLSIRAQSVELPEVVDEAVGLLSPLLAQRGLRLDIDRPAITATIRGDAQRLLQVFINLLANAVKFAPEGSAVHIGGAPRGARLEVWVEDEGTGVPQGSTEAIFERFQRGAGAEPDAPGLGLGLWIVKSIIERHGGSISVQRTGAGRTRFMFDLTRDEEVPGLS